HRHRLGPADQGRTRRRARDRHLEERRHPVSRPRLNASASAAREAVQRRRNAKIGVVHFGPGAFFRAHQAWYFDRLLSADPRWGIACVSLKSPGVRDALAPQDGLYVLAELERESKFEVIGSLLRLVVSPEDPQAAPDLVASPDV